MPAVAKTLEEFLPGGSGGTSSEERAEEEARSFLALPSSAPKRGPVLGCFATPVQGEAAYYHTPDRMALLARQPSVSQPAQPAGRGAGGWMGELQAGDNVDDVDVGVTAYLSSPTETSTCLLT